MKKYSWAIVAGVIVIAIAAGASVYFWKPTEERLATSGNQENTQLANPASTYCVEQGGTVEMRENENGQYGVCKFSDGSECEEWEYYRRECIPKWQEEAEEYVGNGAFPVAPSDWPIYQNKDYIFTLQHPQDIKPQNYDYESGSAITFKRDNNLYFDVRIKKDMVDVALNDFHFLDMPSELSVYKGRVITVTKAPKGYCDGPSCGHPFVAYSLKKNNIFYTLIFYYDTYLSDEEEIILSSFVSNF